MDGDADLGEAAPVLAEAKSVADDLLITPDGGFNPAAFVVLTFPK